MSFLISFIITFLAWIYPTFVFMQRTGPEIPMGKISNMNKSCCIECYEE